MLNFLCEGVHAAPVVTPNVGILSLTDILAVDQACVDIIYAMTAEEHHDKVITAADAAKGLKPFVKE